MKSDERYDIVTHKARDLTRALVFGSEASAVMLSLGFLFVFCIFGAHSVAVKDEKVSCSELYYISLLSERFNETIAHTIHSMTVQGLRMFNPKATEENNVPTVNHDISDEVTRSLTMTNTIA